MINLIFALFLSQTFAVDEFFQKLETPFMEVITEKSRFASQGKFQESWLFQLLHWDGFKTDPTGKGKKISAKCDPQAWQEKVLQSKNDFQVWSKEFSSYWEICQDEIKTGRNGLLDNTFEMVNYLIDWHHHPSARQVAFHLPNDVVLKGLLAMKTDGKKRPLIIFRTGIFSHVQGFMSELPPFMQAFEQSPFNVLVLESITGLDFLKNNKAFSLGGFDEGIQNFLVAKEIQQKTQPLSKYISSVHYMGVSMGAHGILYATLLNELNGRKTINSTLTLCPLLNMRDTFQGHMQTSWKAWIANFWTAPRMQNLKSHIENLEDGSFIQQSFQYLEKNYKGPISGVPKDLKLPKANEDFWSRNDFWQEFKGVKTPLLIMSTVKDPIVTWEKNSGLIESGLLTFPDSNVEFLKFNEGFHCSLGVAYDWSAVATMMHTFFLKNSPNFQLEERRVKVSEAVSEDFDLDLDLKPGDADLTAKVQFAGGPEKMVQIPLRDLEFSQLVPVTKGNRSLWLRWANQNVRGVVAGKDLWLQWKVAR